MKPSNKMASNEINKIEPNIQQLQIDFATHLKEVSSFEVITELFNTLPYAVAILNSQRIAIFANYNLLQTFGFDSIESLLGRRPGEFLNCLHAINNNNHCGVSQNCNVCGAMLAMTAAQTTKKATNGEMRLTYVQEGITLSADVKITAIPLILKDKAFIMLYIHDISHEKRRKALERVFFHDVMNKISILGGFYELLKQDFEKGINKEHIDIIGLIINDLNDELVAQRQLMAAENGDLTVKHNPIFLPKLLSKLISQIEQLSNPKDIKINNNPDNINITILSDQTLLSRIIINMLKNAIEASTTHETITINTELVGKFLSISVHNNTVIPNEVQLQIFQRSYSTKGEGRGLGTYSIKMLTERYLKGKAYFISNETEGTTFIVEIPI